MQKGYIERITNRPLILLYNGTRRTYLRYIENATPEKVHKVYSMIDERDSLMADHIIRNFHRLKEKNPSQKALLILNYRHAYGPGFQQVAGKKADNASRYIYEAFPGLCCNVMLNSVKPIIIKSDTEMSLTAIQDGKWDAAFQYLGITNTGFNLKNSPFGKDLSDYFPINPAQKNYTDVFDGFVFYTPVSGYKIALGIPHIAEEYTKRERIRYESAGAKAPGRALNYLKSINELKIQQMDFYDEIMSVIQQWTTE